MKSVKPSVDILEGLTTGFNMDVSAPQLIHKWFTGHSRPRSCCLTFMLFLLLSHQFCYSHSYKNVFYSVFFLYL